MIVIVSKGRPCLRGATADMLLDAGSPPTFVVPADEAGDYRKGNPRCVVEVHDADLGGGLPTAMQFALDLFRKKTGKIIFMDDDLVFYNRYDGTSRLPKNSPWETDSMVSWLYRTLDAYAHATISPTQFNNARKEDTKEVCAARSILAYRVEALDGVRFDRVPSKNDYDVTLQLLRRGLPNLCAYDLCHNQKGGPELPGGCTEYRNEDLHRKASETLASLHPKYVKVVTKTKPNWPFPRVDVHVSWRKAYNDGLQDRR